MEEKNLIILCLNARLGRQVSERLAEELGLKFLDFRQLLADKLASSGKLIDGIDLEELLKQERQCFVDDLSATKLLVFIDFELFKENQELILDRVIYLQLSKNELDKSDNINRIAFDRRDKFLSTNYETINISNRDIDDIVLKIVQVLGGEK